MRSSDSDGIMETRDLLTGLRRDESVSTSFRMTKGQFRARRAPARRDESTFSLPIGAADASISPPVHGRTCRCPDGRAVGAQRFGRHGREPTLRGRRQYERAVRERLRRAVQPRQRKHRPRQLVDPVRVGVGDDVAGDVSVRVRSIRRPLSDSARFDGIGRRAASDAGCDRNDQPRGHRWQGRARTRSRSARMRGICGQLLRRSPRCRPDRIRLGNRLRRRRARPSNQQHDCGDARRERLHRHGHEFE